MSLSFREVAAKASPSRWPSLAWAMLVLLLLCAGITVAIGVELFDVTSHPMKFNTR